ncbi:MAG: hypothetical protein FPO08_04095 [Geobacter sp.]|nr:MAG: hypothetical protein FPO08_04095 [Geobacter sp.]
MGIKRSVTLIDAILAKEEGQESNILPEFIKMIGFEANAKVLSGNSSKQDFMEALLNGDSRFLHLSCHGDKDGFYFNGQRGTHVGIRDLENHIRLKIQKPSPLRGRFLTVSACGDPKVEFWENLHEITGISCVIAPMGKVDFDESSFFYTSFYFALLRHRYSCNRRDTSERIIDYVDTFQKAKSAYLALGGYGAFRLCFWWDGMMKEII